MIAAASLLLSVAALMFDATGREEDSPPPMPANAIVGRVLIDERGADGVTVALDGRAATATTGGGAFRFGDVEAGTHTIAISNYPADVRFDRTSATVNIDTEGRAVAVNFSGSYIHRPRIARPDVVAEGAGKHSTRLALRDGRRARRDRNVGSGLQPAANPPPASIRPSFAACPGVRGGRNPDAADRARKPLDRPV